MDVKNLWECKSKEGLTASLQREAGVWCVRLKLKDQEIKSEQFNNIGDAHIAFEQAAAACSSFKLGSEK